MEKTYSMELAGRTLSLEFGKYCGQANGSVFVHLGDTVVMVNVTAAETPREGQDFFSYEPDKWDILVSNPPFSRKNEVLKRAFSFEKPFALLMPVNSIQGKARYKIFKNQIQMLCFDGRVDYHTRQNMKCTTKGNHFGSAYFCRDLLPTKLELRQLVKYDRPLVTTPIGGDE